MSSTTINVRVENELKHSAEQLFADLGLNMSSAINLFLTNAVNQNRIPFELSRTPNQITKAALDEYPEMKTNKTKYKRYDNLDSALKDLDA